MREMPEIHCYDFEQISRQLNGGSTQLHLSSRNQDVRRAPQWKQLEHRGLPDQEAAPDQAALVLVSVNGVVTTRDQLPELHLFRAVCWQQRGQRQRLCRPAGLPAQNFVHVASAKLR